MVTPQELANHLDGIERRSNNLEPVCAVASQMGVSAAKKRFTDQRDPEGRPWKRLQWRPSGGNRVLLDRGLLRASIYGRHDARSATHGTNVAHARVHQFGAVIHARKRFMTVPLTAEAQRSGGARRFPRPLVPIVSRSGRTGVLVERARGSAGRRAQFALVKSVRVPRRAIVGWDQPTLDRIARAAGSYVTTGVL